eukprot:6049924-Amphidinium_carterae.1
MGFLESAFCVTLSWKLTIQRQICIARGWVKLGALRVLLNDRSPTVLPPSQMDVLEILFVLDSLAVATNTKKPSMSAERPQVDESPQQLGTELLDFFEQRLHNGSMHTYCLLCNRFSDAWHLTTDMHQKRVANPWYHRELPRKLGLELVGPRKTRACHSAIALLRIWISANKRHSHRGGSHFGT